MRDAVARHAAGELATQRQRAELQSTRNGNRNVGAREGCVWNAWHESRFGPERPAAVRAPAESGAVSGESAGESVDVIGVARNHGREAQTPGYQRRCAAAGEGTRAERAPVDSR